ncbi:MAG TPA: serine/threonine-protein kinase [Candidatus Polarisedimenticolia bacterium]|nr:serine/threonine-protein kinase [Candidatus Polarisedimenticolia bacterium]
MKFDDICATTYDSAHRSFLMVGKTLAHYVVLEKAGAGGMGVVFRARDETLHRDVALKLPSTNKLTDGESRKQILREARAASALNHAHICTIYEVGEVHGQPYIAMEYIAGETLSRRIPPNGLPTELVLDLGAQVADAMDHAHSLRRQSFEKYATIWLHERPAWFNMQLGGCICQLIGSRSTLS